MDLSKCRDVCTEGNTLCIQAATHYLAKGDAEMRDMVRLLWDCSDACEVTARFLNRGSPSHREMCRACAIICSRCADGCEKMADPIMARCAETCRRCAGLCLELTAH